MQQTKEPTHIEKLWFNVVLGKDSIDRVLPRRKTEKKEKHNGSN